LKQENDFTVRPADPQDFDILTKVFNDVFNKEAKRSTLDWKYLENPHGKSIVWVAEDNEKKIVGSLAFVPRKIMINSKERITLLASDGMVFPEWQYKGIFVRLLNIMFDKSWEMGAPLAIAFSGRRSVKGLIRTDWDEVSPVQELVLPLRGSYLFKGIIRRLPFTACLMGCAGDFLLKKGRLKKLLGRSLTSDVKPIDRFDNPLADTGMEILSKQPVFLVKDSAWLNWRFIDNPTKRHRIFGAYRGSKPAGYLVMESKDGVSYIVDMLGANRDVQQDLLSFAIQEALREKSVMIQSMALEGDGIDRLLLDVGFKCLPKYGLLPFMIKVGPGDETIKQVVVDSTAWYLSHGDKDAENMTR